MIHITLGAILSGHIPNFDFLNVNRNLTFGFQENVKIENNCITLSHPPVATYFTTFNPSSTSWPEFLLHAVFVDANLSHLMSKI